MCVLVCVCIKHSTSVLCYYLGEQGNLPLSAPRQTVYKPSSRCAAGIRSKQGDNGLLQHREGTCPTALHNGLIWQQEVCERNVFF